MSPVPLLSVSPEGGDRTLLLFPVPGGEVTRRAQAPSWWAVGRGLASSADPPPGRERSFFFLLIFVHWSWGRTRGQGSQLSLG